MSLTSKLVLPLLISAGSAAADSVGYFDDTSICADSKGLAKCYERADTSLSSCINNNCAGGGTECYNYCNGDTTCMQSQCPNLGTDCMNACSCVQAVNQIDCIASSCWNQVRISFLMFGCVYRHMLIDRRFTRANTSEQSKMSSIYVHCQKWINSRSGLRPTMLPPDAPAT